MDFVGASISVLFDRSLLFGVTGYDTVTFAGASVLLADVATVACLLPARRAARVDVIDVLQIE